MAILRPSPLIGAITGTLGSVDFVQGPTGLYARKRPRATIRRSPVLAGRRNRFKTLVNHWRTMSTAQQAAWRQAAALSNFRNRLGIPRRLNGFQLFLQINLAHREDVLINEDAPDILTATAALTDVTIGRLPADVIKVSFTVTTPSPFQTTWIYAARPVSSSQRRHYGNWKFLLAALCAPGLCTFTVDTEFTLRLGTPQVDEIVGVRVGAQDAGRLLAYNVRASGLMQ